MDQDHLFMSQALDLARRGAGHTSPNPMVGAVVVRDGQVVGTGYHQRAGTPHAEVHALRSAGESARGATLYVTLEPCNHHGRTPPCTEAILAAGVRRVVTAVTDPNPRVTGGGLIRLRQSGLEITTGILEEEARRLNEAFFKYVTTRRPFWIAKYAMTLDGRIATSSGTSRWVTGEEARHHVHTQRAQADAVLAGVGTILTDDPLLTARPPQGAARQPVRVVVDSRLRTPPGARILADPASRGAPLWFATTEQAPAERRDALLQAAARNEVPAEVVVVPSREGRVSLAALAEELARREVVSVLAEGGAGIHASALEAGLADKLFCYVAPKLVGGYMAPGPVGGAGVAQMAEAWPVKDLTWEVLGRDLLFTGYLNGGGAHV